MIRRLSCLVLLAAALAPAPAQAVDLKLDYRVDIPAAGSLRPGPRLTFVDARPQDRGNHEVERIGHIRAGFGIPYPLKTRGTHFDAFLGRWIGDCLAAAGWEGGGSGGPELRNTLEFLWIDGYMGYELVLRLRLDVYAPGASTPSWTWTMDERASEGVQWTVNELNKPINEVLERQAPLLITGFSSPAFASAMGARAAGAAPGVSAGAAGCAKDTDCKGDRICDGGRCVDP